MRKYVERIKALSDNRSLSLESRARFITFGVNFCLIGMSLFYTIFYITKAAWFLASLSFVTFVVYFVFLWFYEEHYDAWVNTSFISILVFTVVNSLLAGWQAGFQNFLFAEIVAFFLPNIRKSVSNKKTFAIAALFALVYNVIFILFITGVDFTHIFNIEGLNKLYFLNTNVSFFTIMMFAFIYSTHSEKRLTELSRRADFDELTKLYNRYAINQILSTSVEEYKYSHKPFSVAILDIDFFKNVNDTYGHNSGDDVLIGIAKILKKYSKTGATVGRWGGEEFIVVAPPNIPTNKFVKDLDSIRKYINSGQFVSNGQRISITISIGVECFRDGWGVKEIVEAADKNLYRAKETGRNKIVY